MTGRIIKGIGGLYFVKTSDAVYECKPKGIFRKDKKKPLVGDMVECSILEDGSGVITDILNRTSCLIRPEVANATQAMLVFAAVNPEPSLNLADRFLVNMEMAGVPAFVVFNKCDICDDIKLKEYEEAFRGSGYDVHFISVKENRGIEKLKEKLKGQITVLAGPSGVGKSSLINVLQDSTIVETGELSEKIQRGKNTTRHSELLSCGEDSWIFDTPGFTSFDVCGIDALQLGDFYPEIADLRGRCRFTGCAHINEPDCAVKEAVSNGKISRNRYSNYIMLYNDIKSQKKY